MFLLTGNSVKYFIHSLFKNSPCNGLPGKPLLPLEDLNKRIQQLAQKVAFSTT
jgi:hypothetical protein